MNVVWFCLDTLRADHLSCYSYFRKTSPAMDRLAAEGVLFPQSRANAVATGPAFTSMFTGRYAGETERARALRADLFGWVERNLAGRSDPIGPQLARSEEVRGRPHRFL